ncbi:MAG: sugar phosphate nucleotidyltransferase [Acidimicrobiales bacterium]
MVLVGGEGTRLRPLTFTTPKQMLPVAGVTMIERVLGHLAGHGVTEAVLSMGYRPDAFLDAFPEDRAAGVALSYAVEPEPLDTAGAVGFAARAAGIGETFLALNGDVLSDLDVGWLVERHREGGAEGTIHLTRVSDPSAFGVVPTDGAGRVTAFVEKPPPGQAPTDLINAGAYVLEPSVLARIDPDRRVSMEREVFPAMVADRTLFAFASSAYWIDAGTPGQYLRAQLDLLEAEPPAPGARSRHPGVWMVGTPVVDGELRPPVLVGDAAYVGVGAQVERSVLGDGSRVMEDARVRRSALLPGAVVRPGAIVEDSIVGEGAVVGEGAKLTGLSVVGGGARVERGERLDGARLPDG